MSCEAAVYVESVDGASPAFTLTVRPVGEGTGIVTSNPGGIECGVDCVIDLSSATRVVLSAMPDADSELAGWSEGPCGRETVCEIFVDGPKTIEISFAARRYALVVTRSGDGEGVVRSDVGGIDCGAACTATIGSRRMVELTAAAADGSRFGSWSGDCDGVQPTCLVTVDAMKNIGAAFERAVSVVSVTLAGTGSGSVASRDGLIACPGTCSHPYPFGSPVVLEASPNIQSSFAGWSGAGCVGLEVCSLSVEASSVVEARFEEIRLAVTKSGTGDGMVASSPPGIECGSTCSARFDRNTVVTLSVSPDGFSRFDHWSGACTGAGACVVTLAAAASVTAHFAPPNVPVTNGQAADLVLGQVDFYTLETSPPVNSSTLRRPSHCDSDGTRLWVVDSGRGRALQWNSLPLFDYTAANDVVGQQNTTSVVSQTSRREMRTENVGVSVHNGTIYFTDTWSQRIIAWTAADNTLPDAALYFGQMSWTDSVVNQYVRLGFGLWVGAGHLIVAENLDWAISIWNWIPSSSGAVSPDVVLEAQISGTTDATSVSEPTDVHYDEATHFLFVADGDHRVMVWNGIPTVDRTPADFVLGQSGFGSRLRNAGAPGPNNVGMSGPSAIHVAFGSLFVADPGNHRVLVWTPIPRTMGEPATAVLGQPDMTSQIAVEGTPSESTMWTPNGICNVGDKLFVTDRDWNRVLRFDLSP
jgi:hypothetical protein